MTTSWVRQTSFAAGQVDPVNWRKTDAKWYLASMQKMVNMEASSTLICKKRPGFRFVQEITAFGTLNMQSLEFVDRNNQYYAVFLTAGLFHIYKKNGTFVSTVVNPYDLADINTIDYAEDNQVLIFSHEGYPPARLYVSAYAMDGTPTFAYQVLNIYPFPAYDFGLINYSNFTAAFALGAGITATLTFSGLSSDPGFTSEWVGGQIIGLGTSAESPAGYGIITAVSAYDPGAGPATGTVIFTINVIVTFGTPQGTLGSQFIVRQPSWSTTLGYPGATCVYQNRLWFAGTNSLPSTVFGSRLNQFNSFDVGLARDTDAIIFKIGVAETGRVVSLNGGKQFEIYTDNNELVCPQDQSVGLTPGTLSIRVQTSYGSTGELKPLTYLNDSFYLSRGGSSFMQFHFSGIGLDYQSKNVSSLSQLLIKNPNDRAIQRSTRESQDSYIYLLNSDRTITSLQFDTGYKLAALTPVVLGGDCAAWNFVTIDNSIFIVISNPVSGVWELWQRDDDYFLDGFQSVATPSEGSSTIVIGSARLNGCTVCVYGQGKDDYAGVVANFGEYVVESGEIEAILPRHEELLKYDLFVGLLYDVDMQTSFIYAGAKLMDAWKRITKKYIDYNDSLNFAIDGVIVPYTWPGVPLRVQSGQYLCGSTKGWQQEQTISVTQHAPFPLNVQSIGYQVAVRYI